MEGIEFADVEQAQTPLFIAEEDILLAELQVEVNDAKAVRHLVEERECCWANDMYPAECQRTAFLSLHFAGLDVLPARQTHFFVELQIALRLPVADKQQGVDGGIGSRRTGSQIIDFVEPHIT